MDSFSDVEPDDPPLLSVETSSLLLPCQSSTVTSVTASSALLPVTPRPTLFEAMAMAPSATEHVQCSIPQVNLLVPDVLPLPSFQDYLSDWADEAADCGRPSDFFLEPVEPLGQPILSFDQGLTTPAVDDRATNSVEEVILPSLSHKESDLVLVRDQPQVELSAVVAPVLRPGSVTSTVPTKPLVTSQKF